MSKIKVPLKLFFKQIQMLYRT